ncbi:MAG: AcrB/AcrD/AcrF family protein, partial [Myxococcaceae bacterium]|nr:AcrB/AcrD/AcrF family protein [Myxococcaceae bacterium]
MSHKSDDEIVKTTHNTARFFTESRHVAWVLLVVTLLWGAFAYVKMPKRKDPVVPVRFAVALCAWPGANAERIEELVTRKMELAVAGNSRVEKVESVTRSSVAVVYVTLEEGTKDVGKELDDIKLKLDGIHDLPPGAGPVQFVKDFGDTAAMMLTVTTPKVSPVEIALRARSVRRAIEATRTEAVAPYADSRATLIVCFPQTMNATTLRQLGPLMMAFLSEQKVALDPRLLEGPGFVGIDAQTSLTEEAIQKLVFDFVRSNVRTSELNPDVWQPAVVRDPKDTEAALTRVASVKYSYDQLDEYSDRIQRALQAVPQVAKVTRSGVREERVYLSYSQERLAAYGVQTATLENILRSRNVMMPGGVLEVEGKNLTIQPSGEFTSEKEIGDVAIGASPSGAPVYLRDVLDISREYENPPRYLNYYLSKDKEGIERRSRAVTLAVQMRQGEQIEKFGEQVDATLADVKKLLPEDLIVVRTSDQPKQVKENIDLFMQSLYEAVGLVVLVALIGFWEWRSAVLMALSIPLTLAMTYGFMHLLGIDLQQVSIASLIIALGLLVDDPVVAGDAIKRELGHGHPRIIAAWLGPTKLATAILFATVTNIVAYLPFLTLTGDVGRFIFTLPVVLTCSLIASRLVSMSFIPMLGYYVLRPNKRPDPTPAERRAGPARFYYRFVGWAIDHRWKVIGMSIVLVVSVVMVSGKLKQSFFPKDLSYLSYVDVWLPEDAPLSATNDVAMRAEAVIRKVSAEYGKKHPGEDGKPRDILASITTFVGGGGPRFWFSVSPEMQQLNYAQLVIQVTDKHDTAHLVPDLQHALGDIPGARIDVRELENGKPVGIPVSVRISGDDVPTLRDLSEKVKTILRASPDADRVRDDWGSESFAVKLQIDPDRANLAGVSNLDVAFSSVSGVNGIPVGALHDGDKQIPIVARVRAVERGKLSDLQNMQVYSGSSAQRVSLRQIANVTQSLQTEKIRRRNHIRTFTVSAFPVPGKLPSEVMLPIHERIDALGRSLPPGYKLEIGGEEEEQKRGFGELAVVMLLSIAGIFVALVLQFKNAVKPLIVFAAIPYGVVGAIVALSVMRSPFGFIGFLGVASLIGVMVSHVIVLFDFIEVAHERVESLRDALLDAGVLRL